MRGNVSEVIYGGLVLGLILSLKFSEANSIAKKKSKRHEKAEH